MRTAQAEGLGKEPDTLEAGCEFWGLPGSVVVRTWSQTRHEILVERTGEKKKKKNWRIQR